jgi:hypothetical protein
MPDLSKTPLHTLPHDALIANATAGVVKRRRI